MTSWPELVRILSGALLSAFFAGSETGAYVVNRLKLRYRAKSGLRRAVLLERLLEDLPGFVTALLVWTNLCVYFVSAACTAMFERMGTAIDAEFAATLAVAPVLFMFSELAPKSLFRRRADGLMLSGARALSLAVRLVRPLALALGGLGKAVRRALRLGEEQSWATVSRRALREQFAEGAAQGVFSGPQRLLVENVLQSASRPALGAGNPLGEGNALPADATAGDLLARAGRFPSSRVPVYEKDPERVVGVVHVLKAWGADRDARLGDLALPPVWLDGDASVVQALASLRRAQSTVGFIAREDEKDEGETGGKRAREVVTAEGLLRHMIAGAGSGAPRRP